MLNDSRDTDPNKSGVLRLNAIKEAIEALIDTHRPSFAGLAGGDLSKRLHSLFAMSMPEKVTNVHPLASAISIRRR